MIIVVTPNPAIDITYHVSDWEYFNTVAVDRVSERPGGKGLNVARVLTRLGEEVVPVGFVGGSVGEAFLRLVQETPELAGVAHAWLKVPGQTRRTIAVVERDGVSLFAEPGAALPLGAWERLLDAVGTLTASGDVVCVCGSFPPGTRAGSLAKLVSMVRALGAQVIVDTSGRWLREAAEAGADVLKPNEHELLQATRTHDVKTGVTQLLRWGAKEIVVSRGSDGMRLYAADAPGVVWEASAGRLVSGNATGAGDAVVAALARSLHSGGPLSGRPDSALRDAVSLGAAAVAADVAGEFVDLVRKQVLVSATVRMIDVPR